ncbi:hypothetical protein KUCAC02_031494, partial [Chaenocephalus aceratus]
VGNKATDTNRLLKENGAEPVSTEPLDRGDAQPGSFLSCRERDYSRGAAPLSRSRR